MVRLIDYFPEFASELTAALAAAGHRSVGREFSEATICRCTHDASGNACYIYLKPSQPNIVQSNIASVKHGRTISVEHPFWVYVDVDNLGRPAGIELLSASSIFVKRLTAFSSEE